MEPSITDIHFEPSLSHFEDDETRWQAVQSRNPCADSYFVYGVRTTKIFCRPTCKARLARRANVRFYATGEQAREAGFRACKRCKPDVLGLMPEEAAVQKIRAFVRDREAADADGPDGAESGENQIMSLSQMARQTGLSKWHFHRVFKKCVGMTPSEYLRMRREASGGASSSGDMNGLEQFDLEDFDFGFLGDPLVGFEGLSTEGSSATQSECGPLSLDDLLRWPDKDD